MFLPGKPTPQFKWQDGWQVKVFFVDYGNIEWLPLNKVRRKKFPYPPGQAFRCALGSIKATVSTPTLAMVVIMWLQIMWLYFKHFTC